MFTFWVYFSAIFVEIRFELFGTWVLRPVIDACPVEGLRAVGKHGAVTLSHFYIFLIFP